MNDSANQIILYDGPCTLCNSAIRFILKHDTRRCFLFAPLESPAGMALLEQHHLKNIDSVMLITHQRAYSKSDAVIAILEQLEGMGWLATLLKLFPQSLRDNVYTFIARRRYRWFGKQSSCPQPDPKEKERFLF